MNPEQTANDEALARLLSQDEQDHVMALSHPSSGLPEYVPYAAQPAEPWSKTPQQLSPPGYQQRTQTPQIIYITSAPLVPIYTLNGQATALVAHHRLPPRLTPQYANAGYPGARTEAITQPQDRAITYAVEQVPFEEAVMANAYGNGTIHVEPYDSNGSFRWGNLGRRGRCIYAAAAPLPRPRMGWWW
ncbi:hypothetical protein BC830DRAFT_178077 [Chytriomyces sp. MP71]|nr:hypothetical protein BC830DRAFT_178077 [Chytriomyces sp. MP71]